MFMKPPEIRQYNRPKNHKEVAEQAAKNAHIGKPLTRLFLYYAECTTGFRPSMKTVEMKTNIDTKNMPRYRLRLAKTGLILFKKGIDRITLDWNIIGAIAESANYRYEYIPDMIQPPKKYAYDKYTIWKARHPFQNPINASYRNTYTGERLMPCKLHPAFEHALISYSKLSTEEFEAYLGLTFLAKTVNPDAA